MDIGQHRLRELEKLIVVVYLTGKNFHH